MQEHNKSIWLKIAAPLFPAWVQLEHPVFRWELAWRRRSRGRFDRLVEQSAGLLWGATILAMSAALVIIHNQEQPFAPNITPLPWLMLWAPHLALYIMSGISTAETVNREIEAGTWESLCVTALDIFELLGTKWAAGLWSLRGLWVGLTVFRVVMTGLLLFDFASFQGQHLIFLTDSSQPPIPWVVGLLSVATGMTASLVQPLVTAGLHAGFGVFVSVHVRSRALARLISATIPMLIWIISVALLWLPTQTLNIDPVTTLGGWLLVLIFTIVGDMGLGLLAIGWLAQLYGSVNWGFLIGPAALVWVFGQALVAGGLLSLAAIQARRLINEGRS